jgi:hypothetical protein
MKKDMVIVHNDRIDYFKRLESSWFRIISIDDHSSSLKKIHFEFDTEHVAILLLEVFTYGALYGIDLMGPKKNITEDVQREVTFNQDINFNL